MYSVVRRLRASCFLFFLSQFTSFHSVFHSFHGLMNSINWPASSIWVFIAQLGEHSSANAEATGSNPVEAPKNFFSGYFRNCLNCDSLRWSHTHFTCSFTITDGVNLNECDCPVECEKVQYSTSLSTAYFPSAHFWDTVYQLLNMSFNDTKTTKSDVQEAIRLDFYHTVLRVRLCSI